MNIEAIIARKKEERRAKGLHVRVTFDGREPFNHYAKNVAERDDYMARVTAAIGKPDVLGHVVRSVEVVEA